jgi:hypothetical protein
MGKVGEYDADLDGISGDEAAVFKTAEGVSKRISIADIMGAIDPLSWERRYLPTFLAGLAAGNCTIVMGGDSMSVDWYSIGAFESWPYLMELDWRDTYGSASVTRTPAASPAAAANIRVHNMSLAGNSISELIAQGDFTARIASANPHLIILCGGLADYTGDIWDYLDELEAGIDACIAADTEGLADGLVIHEYAPNNASWADFIFGEFRARQLAHSKGWAFVSVARPLGTGPDLHGAGNLVNLFDMTAHPTNVLGTDNVHTNAIGQRAIKSTLRTLLVPDPQPLQTLVPYPQSRAQKSLNTNSAKTSMLPSAFNIEACTMYAGTHGWVDAMLNLVNFSATNPVTFAISIELGATVLLAKTYSIATFTGTSLRLRSDFYVKTAGATSHITAVTSLDQTDNAGSDVITEMTLIPSSSPVTASTLADMSLNVYTTMSVSNAGVISEWTGGQLNVAHGPLL